VCEVACEVGCLSCGHPQVESRQEPHLGGAPFFAPTTRRTSSIPHSQAGCSEGTKPFSRIGLISFLRYCSLTLTGSKNSYFARRENTVTAVSIESAPPRQENAAVTSACFGSQCALVTKVFLGGHASTHPSNVLDSNIVSTVRMCLGASWFSFGWGSLVPSL
jgi:hypothetical protein